jgi:rod shape-determining protein MreC
LKQRTSTIGAASPVKLWLQRFAFVLLLTIAFMTLLIGKADTVVVSRARMALIDGLAPFLDAVATPIQTARRVTGEVTDYIRLADENRALRQQNDTLMEWQRVARGLQAQNESLRNLLHFVPDPKVSFITAPIIADTSSGFVRSVVILAGMREGVTKGQAAMTGNGLAGRVLEVGYRASRILLLTDINARVPVIIERTRDQAVLAGDNSPMPDLRYMPRDVDIKIGDRVVTSGAGGAFPSGLPVGEVSDISDGHIRVRPFADLGRLEYVRLVNYALPGILTEDLGIDAAGYDPMRFSAIDGILNTVSPTSSPAAAATKSTKKNAAEPAAKPAAKQRKKTQGTAGTE